MKGLELPINMIVVIVVALIVLIAVAAFFTGSLDSGKTAMDAQQKWQSACSAIKMRNCKASVLLDMTIDNTPVLDMCKSIAGTDNPEDCCEVCCGKRCEG